MNTTVIKTSFLHLLIVCIFIIVCTGCGSNSSDADITYIALGASDAIGVGASPLTNGYVYRIRDGLEQRGKSTNLINLGIPGAETGAIADIELRVAERKDPDLVTLFTGANDLAVGTEADNFKNSLKNVIEGVLKKTNPIFLIATLPDITQLPRYKENPDVNVTVERLNQYNQVILEAATQYNLNVVELRQFAIGGELTAKDGFHPNDEGYRIMAEQFLNIIESKTNLLNSNTNSNRSK